MARLLANSEQPRDPTHEQENTMDPVAHMRERAKAYPVKSPESEAFLVALVRHDCAEEDARIDAAIMRSWAITNRGRA